MNSPAPTQMHVSVPSAPKKKGSWTGPSESVTESARRCLALEFAAVAETPEAPTSGFTTSHRRLSRCNAQKKY